MKPADFETDAFLQLLTDALRSGPGSPAWHEAVSRVRLQRGLPGEITDDYKALLAAREHLESGKGYRSVRAGPQFTRKVMAAVAEEDLRRGRRGPATTTLVALAAGAVGLGAIVLIASLLMSGGGPRRQSLGDLKAQTFSHEILSCSFAGDEMPPGWKVIGSLPGVWGQEMRPPATAPSDAYAGCGVVIQTPLAADKPVAVEIRLRLTEPSETVIPQVFVTDQPEFSDDRGISPHELVWAMQPQRIGKRMVAHQQVVLPDGTFPPGTENLHGLRDALTVRILFNADYAVIESNTQVIYAGVHQLAPDKPRYVGVRFLRRGIARLPDLPGQLSIRISQG